MKFWFRGYVDSIPILFDVLVIDIRSNSLSHLVYCEVENTDGILSGKFPLYLATST